VKTHQPHTSQATVAGDRPSARPERWKKRDVNTQSSNIPSPPKHGRVTAGALGQMTRTHLVKHLAELTQHACEVKTYGGHPGFEVTGQSSQGAFSPGGAAGADYQTTSVGGTPDADSQGPTGD
jgi:hypothetical protein